MIRFSIALILLFAASLAQAQNDDRDAILVPVNNLFKGMKTGDSSLVHSAFSNDVTFVSVFKNKSGMTVARPQALNDFLKAVGSPHKEVWSEMIWDIKVESDGIFAQVWASYGFYTDKTFSHCGVDAFHLMKESSGKWKIFHLADTRRKEGCKVPPEISDQFK